MHRTALALSFAVAVAATAGCSANFPYGMSLNRHNFTSTHHMPVRLELVDTVNGETVWSLDVPVGKEAIVEFENPDTWQASQQGASPANEVRWDILPPDAKIASLQHSQELSGRPVVLKVRRRELSAEIDGAAATGDDGGSSSPRNQPTSNQPTGAPAQSSQQPTQDQSGGGSGDESSQQQDAAAGSQNGDG